MKVVGFNGSARKDGNTAILINYVFEELNKEGIDTELVQFAGKRSGVVPHAGSASNQRTSSVP
jgi:multimeric flavodoxin WrbA